MDVMTILMIAQGVMKILGEAGVSWAEYKALRDKADAEGRDITTEELRALAAKARAKVEDL
jgi:hypothetical protein